LNVDENEIDIRNLCYYLGELTLPIYEFRNFLPSKIAASIVCFALYLYSNLRYNLKYWTTDFEKYTQYKKEDLRECINLLFEKFQDPKPSPSVLEKYNNKKYGNISLNHLVLPNQNLKSF